MLAGAGIVVTEISTPISAPDFAVDSESIPAAPAHTATKKARKSGLAMMFESWCRLIEVVRHDAGRLEGEGRGETATIANGKPTTIAPTIRIAESW